MTAENTQILFFRHIRSQLPPHLSLVDETAALLGISNDSAYRRIRGEKTISFEELQILCSHYKISLDQFLHLESDSLIFTRRPGEKDLFNYEQFLLDVLQNLQLMISYEERELYYLNKDIPIFHHFHYPELAAFKSFFWMKTILHSPHYASQVFRLDKALDEKYLRIGRQLYAAYMNIPSQEIWTMENINSTIRQIEYYRDSGVFHSREDIFAIYDCLQKTMDHIERQAEAGFKFPVDGPGPGSAKDTRHSGYKVYINEFILGDNSLLAVLGGTKIGYINHATLNYIVTRDQSFCEQTYQHMRHIIKRSTLISEVGEKERRRFFNNIREAISARRNLGH